MNLWKDVMHLEVLAEHGVYVARFEGGPELGRNDYALPIAYETRDSGLIYYPGVAVLVEGTGRTTYADGRSIEETGPCDVSGLTGQPHIYPNSPSYGEALTHCKFVCIAPLAHRERYFIDYVIADAAEPAPEGYFRVDLGSGTAVLGQLVELPGDMVRANLRNTVIPEIALPPARAVADLAVMSTTVKARYAAAMSKK